MCMCIMHISIHVTHNTYIIGIILHITMCIIFEYYTYFTTIRKNRTETHPQEADGGKETNLTKSRQGCGALTGALTRGGGRVSQDGGVRTLSTNAAQRRPHDSAMPFPGVCATPTCAFVHPKLWTRTFTAALFVWALPWKQPLAEWIDTFPRWTSISNTWQQNKTSHTQHCMVIEYSIMENLRHKRVVTSMEHGRSEIMQAASPRA